MKTNQEWIEWLEDRGAFLPQYREMMISVLNELIDGPGFDCCYKLTEAQLPAVKFQDGRRVVVVCKCDPPNADLQKSGYHVGTISE